MDATAGLLAQLIRQTKPIVVNFSNTSEATFAALALDGSVSHPSRSALPSGSGMNRVGTRHALPTEVTAGKLADESPAAYAPSWAPD